MKVDKHAWLNLIGTIPEDKDFTKWSPQDASSWLMKNMKYLFISRRSSLHHLYSFWIVTDLRLESSRKILGEALVYIVCKYFTIIHLIFMMKFIQNNKYHI